MGNGPTAGGAAWGREEGSDVQRAHEAAFSESMGDGAKGYLFRWGWLLFFAGIPFLHWSALGLLFILIHWAAARPPLGHAPPKTYSVGVYGLLVAYGVSLIPAVNRLDALGESVGFGLLLLFGLHYAYRLESRHPGWWKRYIWPAPIAGTVSACVGLYQNVVVYGRPLFEGRMVGVHTNPNAYSTALVFGWFLGMAALVQYKDWRRWLVVPYAGVMGAGLLTTGSRGAWVGLIFGMALFTLLFVAQHWKWQPRRALLIGVGALLIGVLIIGMTYYTVGPTTQARMASVLDIDANQDRVRLYSTMGRLIKAHPFFGVGMGNIKHRFGEFRIDGKGQVFGTAHNQLLQVLGEVGLFGFVFFVLLAGSWFVAGWPPSKAPPSLLFLYALLGALFVRDLFDNAMTNFYVFFFANWIGGTLIGHRAAAVRDASP